MQITNRISITRNKVLCVSCGELSTEDLRARRARLCRHASAREVHRILALLDERHRRTEHPTGEPLLTVPSTNWNGTYALSLLPDGTFACSCLSFQGSRGLQETRLREGVTAATCKHLREKLGSLEGAVRSRNRTFRRPTDPTDWQKLVLRAMSVDPHPNLTNAQAYVAIRGLLDRQGVTYLEFENRMRRDRKVTPLPINSFGVEFEGFGVPQPALAAALTAAGLATYPESYNHQTRDYYKVVNDASIRAADSFEIVTPKLFGADGVAKIRTLCRVVRRLQGRTNASCGLHVHVDAWNCTIAEAKNLARLWLRIQPVANHLVPPSRRDNAYARPLTPELVGQISGMRTPASLGRLDRYWSLNLAAFARHGTFEYRLHGGTFNAEKVVSWTIFVLLVTAAARAGLDPSAVPQTWEGVAEAIGLATGTSLIQRAYRYLTERYRAFSTAAVPEAA